MTVQLSKISSWFLFQVTQGHQIFHLRYQNTLSNPWIVQQQWILWPKTKNLHYSVLCAEGCNNNFKSSLRVNMQTEALTQKELGHDDFLLHNKTKDWWTESLLDVNKIGGSEKKSTIHREKNAWYEKWKLHVGNLIYKINGTFLSFYLQYNAIW